MPGKMSNSTTTAPYLRLSTDRMIAEKDGATGWMIFNNPEKRNAVSHDMRVAILEILNAFEQDDEVRVIVLKGAGDKAFVSGADISQVGDRSIDDAVRREREETSDRAQSRYGECKKPIIAMIHGYCLGGGMLTALNADIRIASQDAWFGIPAARLGVAYPMRGVRKLIDVVGPAKAKEILFTGRRYSAQEALDMGLVNTVTARSELEAHVRDLAATLAENAPLSIRAAKTMIDELRKDAAERDLAACESALQAAMTSADLAEGRKAFSEKRRPVFKGN